MKSIIHVHSTLFLFIKITKTDLDDDPMSSSNDEQVNTLMADAMQESSAVASMATGNA